MWIALYGENLKIRIADNRSAPLYSHVLLVSALYVRSRTKMEFSDDTYSPGEVEDIRDRFNIEIDLSERFGLYLDFSFSNLSKALLLVRHCLENHRRCMDNRLG